jgi:hypothetical protein
VDGGDEEAGGGAGAREVKAEGNEEEGWEGF